ncbi:MAG: aminoglycoside 3-N-acetyltransferase [Candidatus Omnitrophica bacterium]|nr:aminoglycoside 3-N-acetyltransferase [Candidatus Omnitrophota bacterium]
MKNQPIVTKSQIVQDLRALGLFQGHTIMLHASVKKIGWVVGGPDVVIESILDVLTLSGTLMMFASWEDNTYDLARWTKERQDAYIRERPSYDPKRSRADSREMGILTEYLRTWPGAYRSRHPFSYVAVGERAKWITDNHPWQYSDGPGSPLEKLCEVGGLVLILGSPIGSVTLLHHSEHLADVPNKKVDRYRMPVLQDGQRVWMDFEEYDTTRGIVDWPDDYFETIVKEYLTTGNGRTGRVAGADSYLFEAKSIAAFGVKWMEEHFNGNARQQSLAADAEDGAAEGSRPDINLKKKSFYI